MDYPQEEGIRENVIDVEVEEGNGDKRFFVQGLEVFS